MSDASETVPLSALQHYSYCPRQCALIHVEQVFDENEFTLKGRWAHTRVDEEHVRSEAGHQIVTALPVWSDRHGLSGKCDVVELRDGTPHPVEFKHGERKAHRWDEVQLCGQAICLEEMFHVMVPEGAIYHISSRRRRTVVFTSELRAETLRIAAEVRVMIAKSAVPPAVNDARCNGCSLRRACMPEATDTGNRPDWHELMLRMEG
ncbi:CRISPR-associated protein Cas4 [Alicyclobacillus cycloheptanicus]|nr:CRISPR-associated protein Cas4 [Alicyclobacillus cycloheptanicus]